MFTALRDAGFEIAFHAHVAAILSADFPEVAVQLEEILLASTIPIEEIVGSGGGETKGTQRLRRGLHEHGWRKHKFEITRLIDGVARESISQAITAPSAVNDSECYTPIISHRRSAAKLLQSHPGAKNSYLYA